VWNDQASQDFTLDTTEPLLDLIFDEKDWILAASVAEMVLPDGDQDGVPDRNDNCPAVLNAAQLDQDSDGAGDVCDADDDGDTLNDVADCAPLDATQGLPEEVAWLTVSGTGHLEWAAVAQAETYDLVRGLLSLLVAQADYGSCLAAQVGGTSADDGELPPAGDGFLYLVRGHDAGCGGGGPLGQDSSDNARPSPCP
jgi:hypothetical protein